MVAKEESVSDAESGWSGVSDNSSTDSECTDVEASSVASDQDRFDLANDLYHIELRRYSRGVTSEDAAGVPLLDGQDKLQELVHLPRTWPLARLTIPLEGLSKQIDRLLEGYCFQILASNRDPEAHNGRVLQTATHLTWILAEYLIRTFVHPNPITFPGIYAPEGLFCCPGGPKNVARKVTAIHCITKDISELVGLLVLLPRDGESIPTLVSTPINLNVHE